MSSPPLWTILRVAGGSGCTDDVASSQFMPLLRLV